MCYDFICNLVVAYFPFDYDSSHSEKDKLNCILCHEYDADIINRLVCVSVLLQKSVKAANMRREKRLARVEDKKKEMTAFDHGWPAIVPKQTIFGCLNHYYEGTKWSDPPVCAVCAQYQLDANNFDLLSDSSLDLDCLILKDEFVIRKCIIQSLSTRFSFVNPVLNGLMLNQHGVVRDDHQSAEIKICSECHHALNKKSVPRFALANGLY